MVDLTNPSAIARETIKTLASRKLAPTPENYARLYQEISGTASDAAIPGKTNVELAQQTPPPLWSELIRDLLRQLEIPHKGITVSRKKDGLETVLAKFAGNQDALYGKLQGLIRSWAGPTSSISIEVDQVEPVTAAPSIPAKMGTPTGSTAVTTNQELVAQLREHLAQSLESTLPIHPELRAEIQSLVEQIRSANAPESISQLARQLRQLWIKLELYSANKNKIEEGLLRLLRLLLGNVGELVADDKWLHGQITALHSIIAQPLNGRSIADAERSLRDVAIKQGLLKQSLTDAKLTLKTLMSTFIDRLGELTESTGEYQNKIEFYSKKIDKSDNITELSHILKDIMRDTRTIQSSAMRSHEELLGMRRQANEAEDRIKRLEQELEQVSELVREDQLTHALNRRGLEEFFSRESSRADRSQTQISIALLDIDNFKQLNDTLGHQAGDQALIHLASVIKSTLRPSDAISRYGGEEFVIVLPDTALDNAVEIIVRLQRELTRKFFLHKNERLLITFSAGVALRAKNEGMDDVINRADLAMYKAKRTGKNRVLKAE